MSTKTNNLNMTLTTGTENITRSVINGNFEIVDAAVKSDRDRLDAIEDWKPSESGTSGQLLRTNGDGTTQWVDQGLPTDEQTADAVNAWLDNHPEATTTVEDGAITRAKLDADLKEKTDAVPNLKSAVNKVGNIVSLPMLYNVSDYSSGTIAAGLAFIGDNEIPANAYIKTVKLYSAVSAETDAKVVVIGASRNKCLKSVPTRE